VGTFVRRFFLDAELDAKQYTTVYEVVENFKRKCRETKRCFAYSSGTVINRGTVGTLVDSACSMSTPSRSHSSGGCGRQQNRGSTMCHTPVRYKSSIFLMSKEHHLLSIRNRI